MAITFVDSTTGGGTGTDATAAVPTGIQANDFLIAVVHWNGPPGTISDNNGADAFTSILANREYNGPSAQVDVFYRVADGGETGSFSFTSDSNRWCVVVAAYRGVDTSDPWDVAPSASTENTGSGTATQTTKSVTTNSDNAWAVTFAVNDSNSVSFTGTPGDSFITRENNSGEQLLGYADKEIVSATTQSAVNWEQSAVNGVWLNHMFVLRAFMLSSRTQSSTRTQSSGRTQSSTRTQSSSRTQY